MNSYIVFLSLFLTTTRGESAHLKNSILVMDSGNIYQLSMDDSSEYFTGKHGFVADAPYLNGKSFQNKFTSVFGSCQSSSVGYFMQTYKHFFSSLTLDHLGGERICDVVPGFNENTFYVLLKNNSIAHFNLIEAKFSIILAPSDECLSNLQLDHENRLLYYLRGCNRNENSQLRIVDLEKSLTSNFLSLSQHVRNFEIDFRKNEIFAISENDILLKGKLCESKKVNLEAITNFNQKVFDIAVTPKDIYFIDKTHRDIRKLSRSDGKANRVYESTPFRNPRAITFLHFPNSSATIYIYKSETIPLIFIFVLILNNLESYNV